MIMRDPWGIGGFRGGGEEVPNEQMGKKIRKIGPKIGKK